MALCTDYSSTRDCFSYIFLGAPNFSGNKSFTLDSVFADIDGGVSAVASRTKNPEALTLLEECRSELRASLQLFKEGKDFDAQKRVQNAQKIFRQAGKLKKSAMLKAERVEDDYLD
jgi:hypothetical protein